MTDVDTAAILARLDRGGGRVTERETRALCDALDAARAERDDAESSERTQFMRAQSFRDQRDAYRSALDAAEARIAAALALGEQPVPADSKKPIGTPAYVRGYRRCFVEVRRALTGDAE